MSHCKINFFKIDRIVLPCLLWVFFSCSKEEILSTDKLEYREDENGIERLYRAGDDEPVGLWQLARVTENHPNGQKNSKLVLSTV